MELEEGGVKIIHHSTASLYEIILTKDYEVEQGKTEKFSETIWLDYYLIDDLKKALERIID